MTEFERAVDHMRQAQKSYFQTRNPKQIQISKHWERQVDLHLEKIKGETLF